MRKFLSILTILTLTTTLCISTTSAEKLKTDEGIAVTPLEIGIDSPELNEVSSKKKIAKHESQKVDTDLQIPKTADEYDEYVEPISKIPHRFKNVSMKVMPVSIEDSGGTLLLSDSPEEVTQNGILYTDVVKGDARVFFYHTNKSYGSKKIAIVVENLSKKMNKIEISRGGVANPSADYLKVGKELQMKYFNQPLHDTMYLIGKTKKVLRPEMNDIVMRPGELMYGVFDFHASQEVRVSILFYPATANPLSYFKRAPLLKADNYHLRGTFKGMNRTIRSKRAYDPEKDGIVYFQIGDDVNDKYKTGIDAMDGTPVTNYGNYGILYTLELPTKKATQFYLSPQGGVYAGAMIAKYNYQTDLGDPRRKLILTPDGRKFFGDFFSVDPNYRMELSDLGQYTGNLYFEYSPPGASNLPVNIILQPVN